MCSRQLGNFAPFDLIDAHGTIVLNLLCKIIEMFNVQPRICSLAVQAYVSSINLILLGSECGINRKVLAMHAC